MAGHIGAKPGRGLLSHPTERLTDQVSSAGSFPVDALSVVAHIIGPTSKAVPPTVPLRVPVGAVHPSVASMSMPY